MLIKKANLQAEIRREKQLAKEKQTVAQQFEHQMSSSSDEENKSRKRSSKDTFASFKKQKLEMYLRPSTPEFKKSSDYDSSSDSERSSAGSDSERSTSESDGSTKSKQKVQPVKKKLKLRNVPPEMLSPLQSSSLGPVEEQVKNMPENMVIEQSLEPVETLIPVQVNTSEIALTLEPDELPEFSDYQMDQTQENLTSSLNTPIINLESNDEHNQCVEVEKEPKSMVQKSEEKNIDPMPTPIHGLPTPMPPSLYSQECTDPHGRVYNKYVTMGDF